MTAATTKNLVLDGNKALVIGIAHFTCLFLATRFARRLSGETFYVDGGAHIIG